MKITKKNRFIFIFIFLANYSASSDEWHHSSGSYKAERYSTDDQINSRNIQDLRIAWKYYSDEVRVHSPIQSTPIYTGTKLISVSLNSVYALKPDSGSLIWKVDPSNTTEYEVGSFTKGITFTNEEDPKIFVPTNKGILEINETNGKIIGHFNSGVTALPPVIHKGKIIIATRWEGVKSFDLKTREKVWHIKTEKNNFQSHIWSGFSFDKETELAFIVTGSSGGVTGWYKNEPTFENSLIAMDINTGEIAWTFQHIEHDLWDLDLVGNPLILSLKINSQKIKAVIALTKTGDIILLDALNGKPIFKDSYQMIAVPTSDVPGEKSAPFQKRFFKPEPFTNTLVDLENDFSHLDLKNENYVKNRLRNSKSGFFLPPSLNTDIVLYGLHGGAEWPGGSIDLSAKNPSLIIPYNRYPWIIRVFYRDNLYRTVEVLYEKYRSLKLFFQSSDVNSEEIYQQNCASCHNNLGQAPDKTYLKKLSSDDIYSTLTDGIMASYAKNLSLESKRKLAEHLSKEQQESIDRTFLSLPFVPNNKVYIENCSSCHGLARQGFFEMESGDKFYPPLIGISLTDKGSLLDNFSKIKYLHEEQGISYMISDNEHTTIFKEFTKYDNSLKRLGLLSSSGFWQILIDSNGYPATKPPWGGIAKTDLVTGEQLWNIPFGARKDQNGKVLALGDKNFGGVLSTATGLIFATGTPDPQAFAFNSEGKVVWEGNLPYAGSAPPMSYTHNNCQYIIFTATGGKWYDYGENGDALVAYKLADCKINEL